MNLFSLECIHGQHFAIYTRDLPLDKWPRIEITQSEYKILQVKNEKRRTKTTIIGGNTMHLYRSGK